jgi:hypothetical protein
MDGGNEECNVIGMTSNIPTRVTSSTTGHVAMEIVTESQGLEKVSSTVGHAHVGACILQTSFGFMRYLSSHPHMVERDDGYFYNVDIVKYKRVAVSTSEGGPGRFEVITSIAVAIGHVLNKGMRDLTESCLLVQNRIIMMQYSVYLDCLVH